MSIDELKRLRQSLDEKNKKLASLEILLPRDSLKPSSLFTFLSSPEASAWTGRCGVVGGMIKVTKKTGDNREST
jgi:hypothetical protein